MPPGCGPLADGYGLDEQQRHDLPGLIEAHTRAMYDLLQSAGAGVPG
jgi:hypothetical protein